jgi:hypothetical protein
MANHTDDTQPLEEPMAELERHLIHAFLAGAGQDYQTLVQRDDAEARRLLTAASEYASAKLSEMEARLHYLRSLQGQV